MPRAACLTIAAGFRSVVMIGACAVGVMLVAAPAAAQQAQPGAKVSVLDNTSMWRALYSWNAPLAKTGEGTAEIRPKPGRGACKCDQEFKYLTVYPADGWTAPEFDDSAWVQRQFFAKYVNGETDGRAGGGMADPHLRQLSLRGKFAVSDPAKVKGLTLSLAFRGGVAVHVNGKEVKRAFLSDGKLAAGDPAEMYPRKVYLREDGKPQAWWPPNDEAQAAFAQRQRTCQGVAIPAEALRKGLNVLAVEIHAAVYPEEFLKAGAAWGSAGLIELHLLADSAEGLAPNVVRPKGVQAWNTNVMAHLYDFEYGDPNEPLRPMTLVGARNGVCSARVAVGSEQPIKGFQAKVSDLTGAQGKTIPASALRIGYGKFDQMQGARWGGALDYKAMPYGGLDAMRDDALLDAPPGEVPLAVKKLDEKARSADGLPPYVSGAVQPVYVTVRIPKDSAPGDYAGTLTITVDARSGANKPIEVPLRLKVIDWTLPDPADFAYFMGTIQSPEGVALTYDVPMWSDKHLELVGKSLEYVGQLGPKVLFLPLGAESQYGNEQSMVLWLKGEDGKFTYDFSAVEKYVDLALKRMGRPQFVVLGVWDSCMHVSAPKELKRDYPRVSVKDPKTGAVENVNGPKNGTPESQEFWKPVLTGVKDILAKRKLDGAMLLGYAADVLPDKATVEVFRNILPQTDWQSTRHGGTGCEYLEGQTGNVPVKYHANVWGGWEHHDPDCRRIYGWKHPVNPSLRTWLDRDLFDASPIPQFRTGPEQAMLADRHGLGQIGVDFWGVKGRDGKPQGTMVGRFPATNEGNLGIYAGQLLYPGPDGPVPSLRYEMVRENVQECEARIFLEKLLTAKPCRLSDELARKCQAVLDERTRWHRIRGVAPEASLYWAFSGWEARTLKLYEAAAEAAKGP